MIIQKEHMTREANLTLAMHGLFIFGSSASLTFFNIYFLRLSESFALNLIYNALFYVLTPLGFWIGGWFAKRYDRLHTLRISLVLHMVFFVLILMLGDGIIDVYGAIALCQGLAVGFYWAGILVLLYDVSAKLNRVRYIGISTVTLTGAGLIGPLSGGWLIGRSENLTGYLYAFCLTLAVFVAVFAISLLIRKKPSRRRRYLLGLTGVMARRNPQWMKFLGLWFCTGFLEGLTLFIPALVLYEVFERENVVSIVLAATSLVSVASSFYMSRRGTMERAPVYMRVCSLGIALSAILLSGGMGTVQVLVFLAVVACLNPVYHNTFMSRFFAETDKLPLKGAFRIESVVLYESLLNFGRAVPLVVLLPFADSLRTEALWIAFVCAGTLQGVAVWLIFRKTKFPRTRERELT
ncbi:MFS transporter [Paenibacillus sp. MSJ-34]|uniref:MFS transporter n=1 Tax=Paenibacillus sp. MSJ-34 TaxID=2841529 RepID=UPI001C112FC2|nr:MFS transporter [Paenibacillus sp. MSJ-34]MBU5442133.1 MFS transporter [Paenibacillus sp. MSJ-34]